MDGRKYQRKSGIKRMLVMLLALVMLASVCFPAMRVNAEGTPDVTVTEGSAESYSVEGLAEGADVTVTVPDNSGLTVTYDNGVFTVNAASAKAGTYTVDYAYQDAEGADQSASFTVTVAEAENDNTLQQPQQQPEQPQQQSEQPQQQPEQPQQQSEQPQQQPEQPQQQPEQPQQQPEQPQQQPEQPKDVVPVEGERSEKAKEFDAQIAGIQNSVSGFDGKQETKDALVAQAADLKSSIEANTEITDAEKTGLLAAVGPLTETVNGLTVASASEPVISDAEAYLQRIEDLKGQIGKLDPDAPDYEDQLEEMVAALVAVVEEAEQAQANGNITAEEYAEIAEAADEVLDGPKEDDTDPSGDPGQPYASGARIVRRTSFGISDRTKFLNINFVDEKGSSLQYTSSSTISVGGNWVPLSTIAGEFNVEGYTYVRAYYKKDGEEKELSQIRYDDGNWRVNGKDTKIANRGDVYLVYKPKEPLTGKVRVYVYVAGEAWQNNTEFQELIGLYACDANGYFPAGEIELDASYFTGKPYQEVGAPLITNSSDWTALLAALGNMDTSKLTGTNGVAWSGNGTMNYDQNKGNLVYRYLNQAVEAHNMGMGSQSTALFRWNDSTSYGFEDQTVEYHLDLAFNTKTITFVTGNNGITNESAGDAKDGTQVDYRTYITGSIIQAPRELNVPTGYKVEGYYSNADFTTEWNGIGTQLNEDQTVYIKITLDNDIGTGAGELHITGEKFWVGDGGTGLRPESINVKLQGRASENGAWTDVETKTVESDVTGKWLYDFNVSDQPYTHYQVIEEVPKSYTVEYVQPEVTFTYPSTGGWNAIHPCNSLSFETYNKNSTIVAAKKGNNYVVWTLYQLTSGEQKLICQSLADSNWNTTTSNTLFFYGYGASTNGIIVTQESVQFSNPSGWSWFKIGTYNKASASATHSTITNTLSTATVTITKQVKGNMGDPNKSFPFEVALTGGTMKDGEYPAADGSVAYTVSEDGAKIRFNLSDDQSVILQNVPLGAKLFITEKDTGAYTVKIGGTTLTKDSNGNASDGTGISVTAEMGEIIVVNENEATIDTGIVTDSIPYILLLTMAVIGAGVLLLNKRRGF